MEVLAKVRHANKGSKSIMCMFIYMFKLGCVKRGKMDQLWAMVDDLGK